jgi:hypothetical protein
MTTRLPLSADTGIEIEPPAPDEGLPSAGAAGARRSGGFFRLSGFLESRFLSSAFLGSSGPGLPGAWLAVTEYAAGGVVVTRSRDPATITRPANGIRARDVIVGLPPRTGVSTIPR